MSSKNEFIGSLHWSMLLVALSMCCALTSTAEEEGEESVSIAEQQREQIQSIMVDMNESAKTVVDTVTSDPQKAIDGGCLSNIQGIDLSVMSVDPTDVWGAVYSEIKDEILSISCAAAENWANEQTARLDYTLQTPIGNVSVGQGSSISDWQSVQTTDVEMSNEEVAESVATDTLGNVPGIPEDADRKKMNSTRSNAKRDSRKLEETMEDSFNLKQLWGGGKDE